MNRNEAFSRIKIDGQMKHVGWNHADGRGIIVDYPITDDTGAKIPLCERNPRAYSVLEAHRGQATRLPEQG